jgi:hypothetical protein
MALKVKKNPPNTPEAVPNNFWFAYGFQFVNPWTARNQKWPFLDGIYIAVS